MIICLSFFSTSLLIFIDILRQHGDQWKKPLIKELEINDFISSDLVVNMYLPARALTYMYISSYFINLNVYVLVCDNCMYLPARALTS